MSYEKRKYKLINKDSGQEIWLENDPYFSLLVEQLQKNSNN